MNWYRSNGAIPMGAVLVKKEIYDTFMQGPDGIELFHGYTYSAHPTACAVAVRQRPTGSPSSAARRRWCAKPRWVVP